MKGLYSSPLRVYLMLGVLALAGVLSGLRLPVSLFPNSSKPRVAVNVSYGDSTPDEFLRNYGEALESQLKSIQTDQLEVEKLFASYYSGSVEYKVEFKWGAQPRAARREVENVVNSFGGRLPKDVRDSIEVNMWNRNSGFLAISFYSATRSLDEVYDLIEPIFTPRLSKVADAANPGIYNPNRKEIRIELNPETMASLGLVPRDIDRAVETALSSYNGGSITIGTQQLTVQMPKTVSQANLLADLSRALVSTPSGQMVHIADVGHVDLGASSADAQSFKTSGTPSLILFSTPRPGGNVKRMSEDIIQIVREVAPTLPKDIEYRILVDPSEFIRASVKNVFHEVLMGAGLAVLVLFLFIGSLRNVVTAAIEIPLSMVLAFILMKLSGMNLNLISLGGLALAAGMNVDASVVVMENIFRHFEKAPKGLDPAGRLELIVKAVSEVRFSVIASTVASLVVFLPLAFTSDLSYAILGDLAKTVVFSHGFSAIVALVLVPTVRLHLMSRGGDTHPVSPIEKWIVRLENGYAAWLERFISTPAAKRATYLGLAAVLAVLFLAVLPRLPREIIGKPDTDWMVLGMETKGNTLLRQMESQADETEAQLLAKLGSKIQYTFNQIQGPNSAFLMARLKDKRDMRAVWTAMETQFKNSPTVSFWVAPWNPAELPIPDPPNLRLAVRGGDLWSRANVAQGLGDLLESRKIFPRVETIPNAERHQSVLLRPNTEQWSALWKGGSRLVPSDLADLARVATDGRRTGQVNINSRLTNIMLRMPDDTISTAEDLASLPVGVNGKVVPFKALAPVTTSEVPPALYREDERELFVVTGREDEQSKSHADADRAKAATALAAWLGSHKLPDGVTVTTEDAEIDLHEALEQLSMAVALSVLLIFITLVLQFGDVVNSALVLVAVPLGLIGVLLSLFLFRSSLSLNSVLGVILLNGIAVANSIILVDFLKRLVDQGMAPRAAAVQAARSRLRPILITSLTTVLGMLPIALGMGEGGRILQPLGIAVSGGLWFSMGLTLFIVPGLQVAYLELRAARDERARALSDIAALNRSSVAPRFNLGAQPTTDGREATERLRKLAARMMRRPARSGQPPLTPDQLQ